MQADLQLLCRTRTQFWSLLFAMEFSRVTECSAGGHSLALNRASGLFGHGFQNIIQYKNMSEYTAQDRFFRTLGIEFDVTFCNMVVNLVLGTALVVTSIVACLCRNSDPKSRRYFRLH